MSVKVLTYVLEHSAQRGNELLTMVVLADHANEDGICWPSVERIGKLIRADERTARRCLRRLEKSGELKVRRGDGKGGANLYWIPMQQTLELFTVEEGEPPPGELPPRTNEAVPPDTAVSPEPSRTVIKKKIAGEAKASPVPALFEAYRHGIQTAYGAEYPPSAAANGILAKMAKRLGAGPALQVLQAYLASTKPFYVARKHALEILAKDATEIWIELQQRQAGGAPRARPVTAARVQIINADDSEGRRLQDYPPGDPQQIAKKAFTDYRNMIAKLPSARYIAVRQGAQAARFSIEELRA